MAFSLGNTAAKTTGFGGMKMGSYAAAKPFLPTTSPFETLLTQVQTKFGHVAAAAAAASKTSFGTFGASAAKPAPVTAATTQAIEKPKAIDLDALYHSVSAQGALPIQRTTGLTSGAPSLKCAALRSTPAYEQLREPLKGWQLESDHGAVCFEEEVNFVELAAQLREAGTTLDRVIILQAGLFQIDRRTCPALNKQVTVRLCGIEPRSVAEMRQFVEQQGFQFGCFFEREGVLVFRMPSV